MRPITVSWGLFILYCLEVGFLFCFVPWGTVWDGYAMRLPYADLGELALSPWTRAALSGFGVIHIGWAIHDLRLVVFRGARRQPAPPPAPSDGRRRDSRGDRAGRMEAREL